MHTLPHKRQQAKLKTLSEFGSEFAYWANSSGLLVMVVGFLLRCVRFAFSQLEAIGQNIVRLGSMAA